MVLTEKQKSELHQSILDYFVENSLFPETVAALKREANLAQSVESGKSLLEKKWTSVVRLQKKVMELEAKLSSLGDITNVSRPGAALSGDIRAIPTAPARSCLSGHRGPITSVCTHPVYSLIASGSEDSTIKLWDYESGQYERTLKGHTGSVTAVAFSPSGELLASASADMSAKLWDMSTFACVKTLRGHDHSVSAVVFGSETLFTASRDTTIKCWEVSSGFCTKTFSGHSDWVRCLAISTDGEILASGSGDNNVIIWKAGSGQLLRTLQGHEHVVESVSICAGSSGMALLSGVKADSSELSYLVASGSRDRSVRLWDALKGTSLRVFLTHENWVRGVVFHPTGKYILSCSDDKSIRVFDIKEDRCLRTISDAQSHFVTAICMSARHPIVISGSVDKIVCVWNCN